MTLAGDDHYIVRFCCSDNTKYGLAAVEKAEREAAAKNARPSNPQIVVSPPPAARNYGVFRPDPTVDTGKALADSLSETPEEKALIKSVYAAAKVAFEKEAAARGWKNNIAAGLTFFTVAAAASYYGETPNDEGVATFFKVMNAALDDIPEMAAASNRDKQGFHNMLIGFGGLLIAGYTEAKQNNDTNALASNKKLAGMLIEMVLKTDPENLRIENGELIVK